MWKLPQPDGLRQFFWAQGPVKVTKGMGGRELSDLHHFLLRESKSE
jgi:hypothetical protein